MPHHPRLTPTLPTNPIPILLYTLLAFTLTLFHTTTHHHTVLANLTPHPTALWTGLQPSTVAYNAQNGLLYMRTATATAAATITAVAYDLSTAVASAPLLAGVADVPVSCGGWLYVSASDGTTHRTWLYTYDAYTLRLNGSSELAYQVVVMACAADGAVLLTARRSDDTVVAMRASDGKRLAAWQLANMSVQGLAVSERRGQLYVADATPAGAIHAIQLFTYNLTTPNTTTHLATLPAPIAGPISLAAIAVDPLSTHLYLAGQASNGGYVWRLAMGGGSGGWEGVLLPYAGYSAWGAVLTADLVLVPNQLVTSSVLVVDFKRPNRTTYALVGERPLLQSVTALAVDAESCLYVAERAPLRVLQLDGRAGRLNGTYVLNNGSNCDDFTRPVAVAVDSKRQVYASLCDGRIGVYNQQQQLVDHVLPFNYSAATTSVIALFVSRNSSQLYYTDMAYPSSIFRYDLAQRKVVQTWSNASATYECLAVDERDASIYACNNKATGTPTIDHYASNGALLSSTSFNTSTPALLSLAVSYTANQLIVSLSYATLLAVDMATGAVSASYGFSGGGYAGNVAVDERTGRVYAMDQLSNGVLLFDGTPEGEEQDAWIGRRQKRAVVLRE